MGIGGGPQFGGMAQTMQSGPDETRPMPPQGMGPGKGGIGRAAMMPMQGMNPGKGQPSMQGQPQGMSPGKGGDQVRGAPVQRTPGKGGQMPMPNPYQQQGGFTPFGQLMAPQMQRPMGIQQQLMGNFRVNPQATQQMLTNGPRLTNPIGGQAPGSGPGTLPPGGQGGAPATGGGGGGSGYTGRGDMLPGPDYAPPVWFRGQNMNDN